jgi:hypothetical protein
MVNVQGICLYVYKLHNIDEGKTLKEIVSVPLSEWN